MRIIVIIVILISLGCRRHDKPPASIWTSDKCDGSYKRVSFSSLGESIVLLHNQKIEVEGYYHSAFETSALSKRKAHYFESNSVWVDFDYDLLKINGLDTISLFSDPDIWTEINRKRLRIRGTVDANSKGHLSSYLGSIKNICRIEVLN